MLTYTFKLYRSRKNKRLGHQLWVASHIYNHCIALHKRYYRRYGKHMNVNRLKVHITKLKKQPRFSYWNELGSQAIQDIAERIERGYQLFFQAIREQWQRKVRPPSFKGWRKYKSFTLKQAGYKVLEGNRIQIGKKVYKYHQSRVVEGKVKTATIKRDSVGDYYLHLCCEGNAKEPLPMTGGTAGFDFGLKTFLTASDGVKIESPLFFKCNRAVVREANQVLSRKAKGSGHRKRARLHLARVHRRVANQRKDWQFKLARELVYGYDTLYFEDLNMRGMQRLWGRKVNDLGFSQFLAILKQMASSRGKEVVQIDRWEATSKTCNHCLYRLDSLDLKVRVWDCPVCGTHHDRDINAALNILRVGASTLHLEDVRPSAKEAVLA